MILVVNVTYKTIVKLKSINIEILKLSTHLKEDEIIPPMLLPTILIPADPAGNVLQKKKSTALS